MDKDYQTGWNNFINESIEWNAENPYFKYDFKKLTKKYGKYYIDYLKKSWECSKDCLTIEEFIKENGNPPLEFLKKILKLNEKN